MEVANNSIAPSVGTMQLEDPDHTSVQYSPSLTGQIHAYRANKTERKPKLHRLEPNACTLTNHVELMDNYFFIALWFRWIFLFKEQTENSFNITHWIGYTNELKQKKNEYFLRYNARCHRGRWQWQRKPLIFYKWMAWQWELQNKNKTIRSSKRSRRKGTDMVSGLVRRAIRYSPIKGYSKPVFNVSYS